MAKIVSIRELCNFANKKKFLIPDLQRNYVWGKDEWGRLWNDIIEILKKIEYPNKEDENPQHFAGVLTIKEYKKGEYYVLDGQQRLTTISVLLDYLNYTKGERQDDGYLKFLKSRLEYVSDPLSGSEDSKYLDVYRFFMDRHYEMNYQKTDELFDVVLNRLFFMLKITDENEYEVFENLNATGKNLDFSELILNHLLEECAGKNANSVCIKKGWNDLLVKLSGLSFNKEYDDKEYSNHETEGGDDNDIEDEFDIEHDELDDSITNTEVLVTNSEDVLSQIESKTSPLKVKKFFNVCNSLTLYDNVAISETMDDFDRMIYRLGDAKFGIYCNSTANSKDIIDTLGKWEKLYGYIVDPMRWNQNIEEKEYAEELYYLSMWNVTAYIPVIMRILYRNVFSNKADKSYYCGEVVKNLLKAILYSVVHTRIFLNRKHAEDRNIEKKIKVLDYILDACREKNKNPNLGSKMNDMVILLSELKDYSEELCNRAEDAIRGYQYNSAGSKFLLTLYLGWKMVYSQEKDGKERAQVEHMVPQNLEGGKFADYGFDNYSVGLLYNLILIKGSTNRNISNKDPLDKYPEWEKDSFGKLFVNTEVSNIKEVLKNCPKDLKESQEERVDSIIESFNEYFTRLSGTGCSGYTFLKSDIGYDHAETAEYCFNSKLLSGRDDTRYIRIDGDKFDVHPKRLKDSAESTYFAADKKNFESFNYDAFSLMESSIKLISGGDIDSFCEWLKKCEESIDQNKNIRGSNSVSIGNETFVYSQKMIHSKYLEKQQCIKKIMGRSSGTNKVKSVFDDNLYLCNDFNISAVIGTLKKIYELYKLYKPERPFGIWVKLSRKRPVLIDNTVIHTEYVNIGNPKIYESWLREQHPEIFSTGVSQKNNKIMNTVSQVETYFSCEEKSFNDLAEMQFVIPEYQRRYVWDEHNWEELCSQIERAKERDVCLYLGTIVLRKEKGKILVVDGQQRLTTLVMFENALSKEKLSKEESINTLLVNRPVKKATDFLKNKHSKISHDHLNISFDVIYVDGPSKYQYDVFSSINSAGKKLTVEEKIKNYLFSVYSEENNKEWIPKIAGFSGFAKAFCECNTNEFCKEDTIYDLFKRIISGKERRLDFDVLKHYMVIFEYIKNEGNLSVFKDKKIPIWIEMINALQVSTADSLMLNWFVRILGTDMSEDEKYKMIDELSQKICMVFFLLYVMDRSGNAKKSANINFNKCMIMKEKGSIVSHVVNSGADVSYWNNPDSITSDIWDQYIRNLQIYDLGQAIIKRFILLMLEYMMINDEYKYEEWVKNFRKQEKLEIEHIFPSSTQRWPKDQKNLLAITQLNELINLVLLESDINKKVKDKMLRCDNDGKMADYGKSSLFMVKQLLGLCTENGDVVYDIELAESRIERLKKSIISKLDELLKSVNSTEGYVPKEYKLPNTAPKQVLAVGTGKRRIKSTVKTPKRRIGNMKT